MAKKTKLTVAKAVAKNALAAGDSREKAISYAVKLCKVRARDGRSAFDIVAEALNGSAA